MLRALSKPNILPSQLLNQHRHAPYQALSTAAALDPNRLLSAPETKITTLPSGLRVATEARHGETATVGVWIDAGSRYETLENNGAAHYLEHLAFKGTKRRSQTGLEIEIENMGAHLNAYTSREQTVYFAKCFKKDIEKSMDILSDMLLHSELTHGSIERERSVIIREMEEVSMQYEEVIMDHLHEAAYSNSGLGMTILGPTENINSLGQNHFRAYIDTHYTAPRMVICGVGAVDHDELVDLSSRYWDKDLPKVPRTNYPTNFEPASFNGGDKREERLDIETSHMCIGFEGKSWTHDQAYALMAIQSMLGTWDRLSGAGAKLPSKLARQLAENEFCHSYNTLNISYKDTGIFGISLVGDQETMPQALQVVSSNIHRLATPGAISAEELARAKTLLKASLMQQINTFSFLAEDIGRQVLTYGRRMNALELFARIDAVTLNDIELTAKGFINPNQNIAIAAIGQIDKLPKYDWVNQLMKHGKAK